jgi:hypothetical protein
MIGTLAVITVGAMPYAPELISFQSKTQPVFSAASEGVASLPVKAIPAAFKQTVNSSGQTVFQHRTGESAHRSTRAKSREVSRPEVIPAKATLHRSNRSLHIVMAKASDHSNPTTRLLVWHSSRYVESGSTVWTLTVWKVTTPNGERQTLQETIVMNSL